MKERVLAKIVLDKPGSWDPETVLAIGTWLREKAFEILANPQDYNNTGKFTARYLVNE